jgi:hypothetical protein
MTRYNSFNLIHKALRAMMYDTALTLQQTHFADNSEALAAIAKVEDVIYHFEKHAHHEDTFMLPAIEAHEPALVEAFEGEHVADIELGNRLVTLLNIFRSCENNMEKINCGSAINKAFRDFMVFNIVHMAKEESEINRVLWANFTDQELIELNGRLVSSIPPADMMANVTWFMRGINKAEAIDWLIAVKQAAPPFVFENFFALTDTELPERFRTEVQEAVMEGELIAS